MLQFGQMKHLYLFTLEITPLEVGRAYENLPSHLTLMSRFLSDSSADALAGRVQPLFAETAAVRLAFGETIRLGPKKVTAHMVSSDTEQQLHDNLRKLLNDAHVEYQYPEFIGDNHEPHVTQREGEHFAPGSGHISAAAYLIEVLHKRRVVRARFDLDTT